MFLVGFCNINWALYKITLPSYEETINKMNEFYSEISSEFLKRDISSLVDYANNKYINKDNKDSDITLTIDNVLAFVSSTIDVSKKVYVNAKDTKDKCTFSIDANEAINLKQLTHTDFKMMNKILDCFIFSEYIKKEYTDHSMYPAIQKECIKAYELLESDKGKEILLQYLPQRFLKVK